MVTTVAPTTPVEAASSAPTMITDRPRPPRILPNTLPIVISRDSAMPDRSRMTPMKMKSGTATRTSLVMKPMYRDASAPKLDGSKDPSQPAGEGEEQRYAGQGEGDREPDQQHEDDAEEHQRGEDLPGQHGIHPQACCW